MDIEKIKSALNTLPGCRYDITNQSENEVCVKIMSTKVKIYEVPIGSTFKIGDFEFIRLGEEFGGVSAILKNSLCDHNFCLDNNDYSMSILRGMLFEEFLPELENEVGEDGLMTHIVDLTSLGGLKDYGFLHDKVSLLTLDRYRNYRKHIPYFSNTWWLSTPYSCKLHGIKSLVCVVDKGGNIDWGNCAFEFEVHPFCVFQPSVMVTYQ